jgi:uncharacterized protein
VISEIWRYPVSSIGGERIDRVHLLHGGIEGDRGHLLIDTSSGDVASPETEPRWRKALMLQATYDGNNPVVTIPGSIEMRPCEALNRALSQFMDFSCAIVKAGDDISATSKAAPRYDAAPLHIITSSTIGSLASTLPDSRIEARRFRPNLVITTEMDEQDWIGKSWRAGLAQGTVTEATKRCGMTMIAQEGLPEDPEILRMIVRKHRRYLGVYASVAMGGLVAVGDAFTVS